MNFLTIESTCDETAAAVVTDKLEVLSAMVASQEQLHEKFNGVVPEIAARAHVERILPVIDETLARAGLSLQEIDAIAVANQPGLSGSLLIGLTAAKSLAFAAGETADRRQSSSRTHLCLPNCGKEKCVSLVLVNIISGGHTNLFRCENAITFEHLGGTIDDAGR